VAIRHRQRLRPIPVNNGTCLCPQDPGTIHLRLRRNLLSDGRWNYTWDAETDHDVRSLPHNHVQNNSRWSLSLDSCLCGCGRRDNTPIASSSPEEGQFTFNHSEYQGPQASVGIWLWGLTRSLRFWASLLWTDIRASTKRCGSVG